MLCSVAAGMSDSVRLHGCPPGSSVHGVLQASILEWVAISPSRGSSRPRDQTCISCISCISRRFFTTSATWETLNMCLVTQSCPTLCDIMNCSPPGSSVHGDSPPGDLLNPGIEPRSPTLQVDSLPSEPPGKPQ